MQRHAIFINSYHGRRFHRSPGRLLVLVQQSPSKCGETSGSVPYYYYYYGGAAVRQCIPFESDSETSLDVPPLIGVGIYTSLHL